jgi:hypothetical protein
MSSSDTATVAGAIRRHGEAFLQSHAPPAQTRRLMAVLPLCRTAALGGHLHRCDHCGHEEPRYNSCGNRHCPNCQVLARETWLAKQEASLLEVPYFHMVFTLPSELQPLILQNKKACYTLLFQSAAKTLHTFGRDPRHGFEGQLGFTSVLHTWNQTLGAHAHLHVLIPAGALSTDGTSYRRAGKGRWLFPVRALSKVHRAVFLKGLSKLHRKGKLAFHGTLEVLSTPEAFQSLIDPLYQKEWVVFAKRPFAGPRQVLAYLGRYTHKVGIANPRILEVSDQTVSFRHRDPKDATRKKTLTLQGPEFLRRFFLHALPDGFTRIRHYGYLGNAVRKRAVARIREIIGQTAPTPNTESAPERIQRVYGVNLRQCPQCKTGNLHPVGELTPFKGQSP